jgi:hypothetical protein
MFQITNNAPSSETGIYYYYYYYCLRLTVNLQFMTFGAKSRGIILDQK